MSEYRDYGYQLSTNEQLYSYLFNPILNHLSKQKNTSILDIGCGNGWLTNLLIEKGFNAFGIDASISGITIAKQKNPDNFFLQDLTKDDLPDEIKDLHFDTIISTEVIEHLYSPSRYLDFCRSILQKSGKGEIILSTPYNGYLKNLAIALLGEFDRHITVLWEGGHIKFWSKKTLTKALNQYQFRITKFIGCGRLPYLWKSMIIIGEYDSTLKSIPTFYI